MTEIARPTVISICIPIMDFAAQISKQPSQAIQPARSLFTGPVAWRRFVLMGILISTFLIFAKSFSFRFVYDDNYQIVNNDHLLSWHSLPLYFTQKFWSQIPDNSSNLYRPFFLVWLRLNIVLFGRNPWPWHVMTVMMHVLVTWLVYMLARKLLRNDSGALLAAAIFGLHPIHVEVGAWIAAVNESLNMTLLLLAFLCYLKQRSRPERRFWWLLLSLSLFAAAVLVKETGCVLPLLLVAYELTLGRDFAVEEQRSSGTGWLRRVVPYFAVLGAYLVVRRMVMHTAFIPGETSLTEAILSQPWLILLYLKMLVWPVKLAAMYDFPYTNHIASWRFAAGLALILICAFAMWKAWKQRARLTIFAAAWFLITLAPALAAFCLAYKSESYHDRYLYLPSFAAVLLAGAAFQHLLDAPGKTRKMLSCSVAILLLGFMSVATWKQLNYWRNNYVLFQRATEVAPQNERAAANLAAEMIYSGNFTSALQISERMMKLHPDSVLPVRPAALAAFLLHDFSLAETYYAKAAALDPGQGSMYFYLGVARIRLDRYPEAVEALQKAAALSPGMQGVHYNLGIALMNLGKLQQARDQFAAELKSNSSNVAARQALADLNRRL